MRNPQMSPNILAEEVQHAKGEPCRNRRESTQRRQAFTGRNFRLTLVANGAVLSFVVIERHHEHVIATDAHPVNLGLRLAISSSFGGSVRSLRVAHKAILSRTRPGKHHSPGAIAALELLVSRDRHDYLASKPAPQASS